MATHNHTGSFGEDLAAKWLEQKGFKILYRNWRYSHYEIDIIAQLKDKLHIIEIKTRNYSQGGFPEDSVTKKKFKYLQKAADEFLFRNPGIMWLQYDILSITIFKDREPEFYFIEDVFL